MQVLGLSKLGSDPVGRVALGKRSNILSLFPHFQLIVFPKS